jgi:hypothetical protein
MARSVMVCEMHGVSSGGLVIDGGFFLSFA